jgi:hypothetical protein
MGSPETDVSDDDDLNMLRRNVLLLAQETIARLLSDLRYGSITQRNNAVRIVSPHLLRMLDATGQEDQLETLKEAVTGLMQDVRSTNP